MEFEHQLSNTPEVDGVGGLHARLDEISPTTVYQQLPAEVLLDEEMNLSLRLSILDRYDSNAQTASNPTISTTQ